jgi:hypothetical protein
LHVAWEKLDNPATAIEFREVTMINIKQLTNQGLPSIKAFSKGIVEAAKSTSLPALKMTPLSLAGLPMRI